MRERIVCLFLAANLAAASLSAAHISIGKFGSDRLRAVVANFFYFSGSGNTFGFFAPGVGPDARVLAHAYDGNEQKSINLSIAPNQELRLRLSTAASHMIDNNEVDLLMASWANWTFSANPRFLSVVIELQYYYIPPFSEPRKVPAKWRRLERMTFGHEKRILQRKNFTATY